MNWKYVPLLSVFALAGCDGTAIEFAKQTKAMLDAYEKSIDVQIAAETKYYNTDAVIAKSAGSRQFEDSLGATRDELSTELSLAYLEGKKSTGLYRRFGLTRSPRPMPGRAYIRPPSMLHSPTSSNSPSWRRIRRR